MSHTSSAAKLSIILFMLSACNLDATTCDDLTIRDLATKSVSARTAKDYERTRLSNEFRGRLKLIFTEMSLDNIVTHSADDKAKKVSCSANFRFTKTFQLDAQTLDQSKMAREVDANNMYEAMLMAEVLSYTGPTQARLIYSAQRDSEGKLQVKSTLAPQ